MCALNRVPFVGVVKSRRGRREFRTCTPLLFVHFQRCLLRTQFISREGFNYGSIYVIGDESKTEASLSRAVGMVTGHWSPNTPDWLGGRPPAHLLVERRRSGVNQQGVRGHFPAAR